MHFRKTGTTAGSIKKESRKKVGLVGDMEDGYGLCKSQLETISSIDFYASSLVDPKCEH